MHKVDPASAAATAAGITHEEEDEGRPLQVAPVILELNLDLVAPLFLDVAGRQALGHRGVAPAVRRTMNLRADLGREVRVRLVVADVEGEDLAGPDGVAFPALAFVPDALIPPDEDSSSSGDEAS